MSDFLFTSESVSEGHPDKVADAISDGVLDAVLAQDRNGRVAAETLVATGLVVMAGQITTNANVNYGELARDVIKRIGYDDSSIGFDYRSCAVLTAFDRVRRLRYSADTGWFCSAATWSARRLTCGVSTTWNRREIGASARLISRYSFSALTCSRSYASPRMLRAASSPVSTEWSALL